MFQSPENIPATTASDHVRAALALVGDAPPWITERLLQIDNELQDRTDAMLLAKASSRVAKAEAELDDAEDNFRKIFGEVVGDAASLPPALDAAYNGALKSLGIDGALLLAHVRGGEHARA